MRHEGKGQVRWQVSLSYWNKQVVTTPKALRRVAGKSQSDNVHIMINNYVLNDYTMSNGWYFIPLVKVSLYNFNFFFHQNYAAKTLYTHNTKWDVNLSTYYIILRKYMQIVLHSSGYQKKKFLTLRTCMYFRGYIIHEAGVLVTSSIESETYCR